MQTVIIPREPGSCSILLYVSLEALGTATGPFCLPWELLDFCLLLSPLMEQRGSDNWLGSLGADASKELSPWDFTQQSKPARGRRGLCQPLINQNHFPGVFMPQWIWAHSYTPVTLGDFGLGLLTLRHQKKWPTVHDLCVSCYLRRASGKLNLKKKISRQSFWSLHRHSEAFLQVLRLWSVSGFYSLKSIPLDRETKAWTQKADAESFITNCLTRSELEHLKLDSYLSDGEKTALKPCIPVSHPILFDNCQPSVPQAPLKL